tara:strand:- start:2413 stop:2619 length:207 start_codon:yes stop_codon:yes gene_type:complete
MLENILQVDLGKLILSLAIIAGFILAILTVVRSIEIPIRIYMDKKKRMKEENSINKEDKSDKGFASKE